MKTIITVQHTQSVHHTNAMVGSWTDWDLTSLGEEQAKAIALRLALFIGKEKVCLYSSDLKRAYHTAQIIGKALGADVIKRKELRERNLGCCCGKSVQWMRENQKTVERSVDDRLFDDAESRRDEYERLRPFYDEIISSDENLIVIVSHGDLLGTFFTMFSGLDIESADTFEMKGLSGGVSILEVDESGRHIMRRLNDMSFVSMESPI